MKTKSFKEPFLSYLRGIVRNHDLAKFGDVLTNFIYSLAKTKTKKLPFGVHVLDKVLAEAMRQTNLRELMPSRITTGQIGDGAEALIGHAFLEKILTIEKMTTTIEEIIAPINQTGEQPKYLERDLMIAAFVKLLESIVAKIEVSKK
ncbi:MAG: ribonuclease III family protein [Candidatus Heimdallarchaeota archaeon]